MSNKSCPFLYSAYIMKIGRDFLDILYKGTSAWEKNSVFNLLGKLDIYFI